MEAVQEAIKEAKEAQSPTMSLLESILYQLTLDQSCYEEEAGDCSEFGCWACLFNFNLGEVLDIEKAVGFKLDGPHIGLKIDDQGFKTVLSEPEYRAIDMEFGRFLALQESVESDPDNIYIYQADVWCDDCGREIREELNQAGKAPDDPGDESSYDSDNYPKRSYKGDHESDSPSHCASGPECLNAEILPDGTKIGMIFGALTNDGVLYVTETHKERPSAVTQFWMQH